MPPYQILLAEDHVLFRELIKKSLVEISDLEVVGEVSDGLELLASLKACSPQMIILDIGMPNLSGIEAAKIIKRTYPQIKILILTMYNSKDHLHHALELGVDGYLLKENAFSDLIRAIKTIRDGKPFISNIIQEKILEIFLQKTNRNGVKPLTLSKREIEVLTHVAKGHSAVEISEKLLISRATVRNHITKIKNKLNVKRKIELVRYALKEGYTPIA